jgi:hypothetical protein
VLKAAPTRSAPTVVPHSLRSNVRKTYRRTGIHVDLTFVHAADWLSLKDQALDRPSHSAWAKEKGSSRPSVGPFTTEVIMEAHDADPTGQQKEE